MKRTEIYQNGEYLKKNPTWDAVDSVWKVKWIKNLLDRNSISYDTVADVGCGAGQILQGLCNLYPGVKQWKGYDISPQAILLAKKLNDARINFFNEDFLENDIKTGLLLSIDVIEHVPDFYGFLEKLRKRSAYFIFHIPLDLCCRAILKPHILLQQREDVGHVHYFSKEMVLWMLNDTGYQILDWEYTKPMIDLLPQSSAKNKLKQVLRRISFSIAEDKSTRLWGGYSMMLLAK